MIVRESILSYNTASKDSIMIRMEFIHGKGIIIVKGKHTISATAPKLIGKTLNPKEVSLIFGTELYEDWAGKRNCIKSPSLLLDVESNRASCYLVFRPI